MKFYSMTAVEEDQESLQEEYKAAQEVGKLRLGTERLFVRSMRKVYYIPYKNIYRYFRRVMLVPAKLCCGKGNLSEEYLVICCADDQELTQIPLPSSHAAKALMDRMEKLVPDAIVGAPEKALSSETEQANEQESAG